MRPTNAAMRSGSDNDEVALSAAISQLIEANIPYAHAIAAEVIRKLPPELDKRDIQRWAELGLVEAANSFDARRGVQFKTFAYYRIKGAVYDGLRKMGWYPKGEYQRMRFEMSANEYLKDLSAERRTVGSSEAQLNELRDLTGSLATCYMLSLEAMADEPADHAHVSAEQTAVSNQQQRNLRRSLAQMPDKNRRVLEYCYFDELTFEEIGHKLGLSKSWVCRLHAKSLEMLRDLLLQVSGESATRSPATFSAAVR